MVPSTLRTDQGHFSFTDNQQQELAAAAITVCCVLTRYDNDTKVHVIRLQLI